MRYINQIYSLFTDPFVCSLCEVLLVENMNGRELTISLDDCNLVTIKD